MCLWFHVSLRESWICLTSFHKAIYLPKSSAIQIGDSGTPTHALSVCCQSTAVLSLACDTLLPAATAGLVVWQESSHAERLKLGCDGVTLWLSERLWGGCDLNVPLQKFRWRQCVSLEGLSIHRLKPHEYDWSLYKKGFLHSIPCRGCRAAQTMSLSLGESPTVKKFILPFTNCPASGILS